MASNKSIYFVSDIHLGSPNYSASLQREKHLVNWLDFIAPTAQEIILLGDVFDFWFEYKHAVPRGYTRFLGKLAELSDQGFKISLFTGNHDLWYHSYFPQELGIEVFRDPQKKEFFGKKFYFAHGDGLGPGDHGYKLLKTVATNPFSKWMYRQLHPDRGIPLASFFSKSSKKKNHIKYTDGILPFLGEKEFLMIHSRQELEKDPDIKYFIYGHRHIFKETPLNPHCSLIYLGDWINHFSYLEINATEVKLKKYPYPSPHP